MTYAVKKSDVEHVLALCESKEFVMQFEKRIHPRFFKVIMLRHGHEMARKMQFNEIAPYIVSKGKTPYQFISDRQISKIYTKLYTELNY